MFFNLYWLSLGVFLLFAGLTILSDKKGLTLLVALLPLYGIRLSFWGVPSTLLEVIVWGTFVGWVIRQWHYHGRPITPNLKQALGPQNPFHTYAPLIILWLAVATAAMWYSPNPLAALGIWKAYFIEPLMVFVMIVLTFKNRLERWWIPAALGLSAVAMASLAILQKMTGQFLPEPWATNLPLRVTSWYSYPNAVGLFAAPILAMFLVWFIISLKSHWAFHRFSWRSGLGLVTKILVIILLSAAIVFAVSKGAMLGVIVGLFFSLLIIFRRQWYWVVGGAIIISGLILSSPFGQSLVDEIMFRSPSGVIRKVVWSESLDFLIDHPLAGSGLAGYQTALEPYHQWWRPEVSPYKLEIFLYPHNVFLNVWTELGLAGLLTFLALLSIFFYEAWMKCDRLLSVMAVAAMIALLTHGLVDVPYFKNDLAVLFWIIMALPLLEPSRHSTHRDNKWFDLVVRGDKTIEARLNDLKRQGYRPGDIVKIHNRADDRFFHVEIIELIERQTFAELLHDLSPEKFGFSDAEHGITEIRRYYSPEQESAHGVVGIRVKIIEP
jgi:putative inorganic carbon (HCO3(-)) transporter